MSNSKEKKKDNPKYETPVAVKLNELDKASGAEGCQTGSGATVTCTTGSAAGLACATGAAVQSQT